MAVIKCKMCGGDLNLVEGASTAQCEYCGSVQTVPKVDDEKKLTLFARANRLRAACEFDKAAGIYESIVADFPEEAEAYWGLVLCKHGIEYVDDPATGKKIPTCHRSSFDSIMEDSDFEQALENADGAARRVYREEAKQIEEIRKGIIAVSANEDPYDIFICYKETADDGERTLDSVLAQDVYDALTDMGYRVFFSRISLEDKLGMEYEPYIFAALNSARIMLAFGTDYEYFNAVWVKNEWSRFLKLMAKDKDKHLIPCFKGIDAYDMPKEFARLQAQDLGKVGAMQDLLRGIEKLLPRQSEKQTVVQQTTTSPSTANFIKRGNLALEEKEWDSARNFFEDALNLDAECAEAYLGLAMCEQRVNAIENLVNKHDWNCKNYRRVKQFASVELQARLEELERLYLDREKKAEEERIAREKKAEEERIAREKKAEEERIAREKKAEEERIAREKKEEEERKQRIVRLKPIQEKLKPVQSLLSAGFSHTVGLKADGTVVAVGWNSAGRCDVSGWKDIVAISAALRHTVGLRADGTVVAVGKNNDGQCDVSGWKDIVAISAGENHTVGLRADGTVVAVGKNDNDQCDVSGWKDIVAISAGSHTVGLKADGTVVAVGDNEYGRCDVSGWKDIVAISAGLNHTVGLKADGTVVAIGDNEDGQCKVSGWKDIVAISAGSHTVGLKADGTVVAVRWNGDGQCKVSDWKDIVAIAAGDYHTVGLKADGTVVAIGDNEGGQCNVSDWKLFDHYENIEQERETARIAREKKEEEERIARKKREEAERIARETRKEAERIAREKREEAERIAREKRKEAERIAAQRRAAGKCQHCGGTLKGLFSKKCVSCGKPKDY